jgi:hypothetical protein
MMFFRNISLLILLLTCLPASAQDKQSPPVDFDRDIRPILSNTCFNCHGPDESNRKAKLRLDTRQGAFADRGGYAIIVPGQPDKSELYVRISAKNPVDRMPPVRFPHQLSKKQMDTVRLWIEQGADWREHWAFVPPQRPDLPKIKDTAWPKNDLDHFILTRLEKEGLSPSEPAAREKWLRRVTLDLTGLPPTLKEIDDFLADKSPGAFETVVDRLLASPRYGEHMAVEWLDAARYADTNGYQQDRTRTMWPWRDWVVQALNDNMPFDQFTIEQLAGDLLPNAKASQKIATGFNRNHMLNGEGGRLAEESRVEYVMDRVETTSTVWLGLTMGCCRCHNHKYDPVSQKEFYRFYAFFNSIDEVGGVDRGGNARPVLALPTAEQTARLKKLREELAELQQRQKDAPEEKSRLSLKKSVEAKQKAIGDYEKSFLEVMVMEERPAPRDTFLLNRGEWNNPDKSEKLTPAVPAALPPLPKDLPASRLALARWLVDPAQPLTARVAVNRYWQHFFGTGLVKTVEDFGSQGEPPTHPELLDWLATEFVCSGWNVKHMHRLIVLSATYRQSSRTTPELLERDPNNVLLSRGPRVRLSSLVLRDQALFLSGLLVTKMGGPSVKPYQPDVWFDLSLGKTKYVPDKGDDLYRRSIYTFWRRSVGPTMFFDSPARQVCTVRVTRTNTPLHALTLMNDIGYIEAARVFAQTIMKHKATPEERLALAFRTATGRYATPKELTTLTRVLHKIQARYQADPAAANKLIRVGAAPPDTSLNPIELAAYSGVMNLILNLDEVLTKE